MVRVFRPPRSVGVLQLPILLILLILLVPNASMAGPPVGQDAGAATGTTTPSLGRGTLETNLSKTFLHSDGLLTEEGLEFFEKGHFEQAVKEVRADRHMDPVKRVAALIGAARGSCMLLSRMLESVATDTDTHGRGELAERRLQQDLLAGQCAHAYTTLVRSYGGTSVEGQVAILDALGSIPREAFDSVPASVFMENQRAYAPIGTAAFQGAKLLVENLDASEAGTRVAASESLTSLAIQVWKAISYYEKWANTLVGAQHSDNVIIKRASGLFRPEDHALQVLPRSTRITAANFLASVDGSELDFAYVVIEKASYLLSDAKNEDDFGRIEKLLDPVLKLSLGWVKIYGFLSPLRYLRSRRAQENSAESSLATARIFSASMYAIFQLRRGEMRWKLRDKDGALPSTVHAQSSRVALQGMLFSASQLQESTSVPKAIKSRMLRDVVLELDVAGSVNERIHAATSETGNAKDLEQSLRFALDLTEGLVEQAVNDSDISLLRARIRATRPSMSVDGSIISELRALVGNTPKKASPEWIVERDLIVSESVKTLPEQALRRAESEKIQGLADALGARLEQNSEKGASLAFKEMSEAKARLDMEIARRKSFTEWVTELVSSMPLGAKIGAAVLSPAALGFAMVLVTSFGLWVVAPVRLADWSTSRDETGHLRDLPIGKKLIAMIGLFTNTYRVESAWVRNHQEEILRRAFLGHPEVKERLPGYVEVGSWDVNALRRGLLQHQWFGTASNKWIYFHGDGGNGKSSAAFRLASNVVAAAEISGKRGLRERVRLFRAKGVDDAGQTCARWPVVPVLIEQPAKKIPDLKEFEEYIIESVRVSLSVDGSWVPKRWAERAIRSGRVLIVLDGVSEYSNSNIRFEEIGWMSGIVTSRNAPTTEHRSVTHVGVKLLSSAEFRSVANASFHASADFGHDFGPQDSDVADAVQAGLRHGVASSAPADVERAEASTEVTSPAQGDGSKASVPVSAKAAAEVGGASEQSDRGPVSIEEVDAYRFPLRAFYARIVGEEHAASIAARREHAGAVELSKISEVRLIERYVDRQLGSGGADETVVRTEYSAASFIAYVALRASDWRPTSILEETVLYLLREVDLLADRNDRPKDLDLLLSLHERSKIIRRFEERGHRLRFSEDPVAECLAARYIATNVERHIDTMKVMGKVRDSAMVRDGTSLGLSKFERFSIGIPQKKSGTGRYLEQMLDGISIPQAAGLSDITKFLEEETKSGAEEEAAWRRATRSAAERGGAKSSAKRRPASTPT